MIEWCLIEKINQYPNLVKMFDKVPVPFTREIILNDWGSRKIIVGIEYCIIHYDWMDKPPNC